MRAIFLAFCILFTSFSFATADTISIDTSTLKGDELQKIQKVLDDSKKVAVPVTEALNDPKKLNEWVDLGKNLGAALSSTAKELGTGAVEFSKTPMGSMVTFIILWKLFASDIAYIGLSLICLILANGVMYRIYSRKAFEMSYEGPWYWRSKVERKSVPKDNRWSNDEAVIFGIALLIFNLVGFIAALNIG